MEKEGDSAVLKSKEAHNAVWIIGGKVVQMLLSVVVGILTARYLGPGNQGLLQYGTAWVTFFTALSNLGINSVIVKEFVDYPNEQGKTLGTALVLQFVSSLLSAGIIVGCVCVVDFNEPTTILVVALCSMGLIFHIFDIINYWFQAQYKSKITAMATLIAYVVTSAYKFILLVLDKDVRWFALAYSVDYIVIAVFLLIAYRRYGGESFSFSLPKAKSLLKKSYHYILSSLMVALYTQTDKLMLKQMLSETEVAYYATAATLCTMWAFVLAAIIDSMYPTILRLYSTDKEAFEKKNRQLYAIVFYVSCFVSILLLVFGDWGINLLYGEAYAPASAPLKILSWFTAFSYLGVARNAWIVSEGKQKYLKYMYCGAAILNILLNALCIPLLGAAGAAVASLVTQIFTSIVLPMCFREMRPNAKLMIEAIFLRKIR